MSDKLIKELLIKVSAKGLGPVANNLEKVSNNLENAAAGAELLDQSLKPIPDSLKQIIKEAEDVDNVFSSLGKSKGTEQLDDQFEQLDETLHDLIGSVLSLQDAITTSFKTSINSADSNMKELIHTIERFEDSTENSARSAQKFRGTMSGLGSAGDKVNRGLANTARQGRGTARTFADIAKFAGPLPGLYAIIAANAFALSEAFRVMSEGDQLNRLEKVGSVLGAKVGVPIQSIARAMEEATGYTISYEEALKQASTAATYGFSSTEIEEMTKAARRASVALGVDMNDALNRITRGVSKLEIELLDELGITVRLNEAYDSYAASVGKSVTALSGYEKQQAYLNAVLKESVRRQGEVDKLTQATGWESLGAAISSATSRGKKFLADFLEPAAGALAAIFSQSPEEKIVKTAQDVINTVKEAGSSGNRGSYILSLYGIDEKGSKELDNAIENAKAKINKLVQLRDGIISAGGDSRDRAIFDTEISRAKSALSDLEESRRKLNSVYIDGTDAVEAYTTAQLEAKAVAYKNVDAADKSYEALSKLENGVRGAAEPYVTFNGLLKTFTETKKAFLATGETEEEFWKRTKDISKETYEYYTKLGGAMERLAVSATKASLAQAQLAESDRARGTLSETTEIKNHN